MSLVMRRLIWLALLVGGWSVILDWQDEISKLLPERERLERLRSREQTALSAIDWKRASQEGGQARLEWLNRLPEVSQPGVFRAEAMETMADLCKRLDAPCQIAAMGETATPRPQTADRPGAGGTPMGKDASSASVEIQGLISTSVRVSTMPGKHLIALLQEIEDGAILRKIDRFTVRGGSAEIIVKTYGMDQQQATALKSAALRQAEGLTDPADANRPAESAAR